MTAKPASTFVRDIQAAVDAREGYEQWIACLRRKGAFLTARRLKRASLAELLNPDTPGYGGTRERVVYALGPVDDEGTVRGA